MSDATIQIHGERAPAAKANFSVIFSTKLCLPDRCETLQNYLFMSMHYNVFISNLHLLN